MTLHAQSRHYDKRLNPAAATAVIAMLIGAAWTCVGVFIYLVVF